jgi:hypothetical protein
VHLTQDVTGDTLQCDDTTYTIVSGIHPWVPRAIGWVMGIAGFLIARDAAVRLWWPQLLGGP